MYEIECLLDECIYIDDLGEIKQIKVKDVIGIGEDKLNEYLGVLSFTKDHIQDADITIDLDKMKNFDIIQLITDKEYKENLRASLEFFTQKKVNVIDGIDFFLVGKKGRLHRDNFDKFVDVILTMCNRQRAIPEKTRTENLTDRQKQIYEKITKHRKRHAEKNRFHLVDIIKIVKYGGSSFLSKDEIKNLTYYELMSAFEVIVAKSNYDEYLRFKTSPKYDVEEKVQHWTYSIKI